MEHGDLILFALQEPGPLPYLAEKNHINYDIPLEVWHCYSAAASSLFLFMSKRDLSGARFFSFERSGLSPKVKMMHQLSQKLISSICKYTAYSFFHFKCSCVLVGCNPSTILHMFLP